MRIVTWNTWWCFGPWRERQPLLLAAIADQAPDVVLLQETWDGQARSVAEACGLAVIGIEAGPFHPQGTDGTDAGHVMGNAVLADPDRARLVGSVVLPSGDDRCHRTGVAVAWQPDGDGPELLAVATHLNHIAPASAVRQRQLDRLRWWLDQVGPGPGPVVVGGDLNLTPYSPEYRLAVEPHWVDLWRRARPDDPGSTMVPANPRFRDIDWMDDRNGPGHPPGVRFDYLLARRRPPSGDPGFDVDAIERIGDDRHGWPSDHLGLVADLAVSPR